MKLKVTIIFCEKRFSRAAFLSFFGRGEVWAAFPPLGCCRSRPLLGGAAFPLLPWSLVHSSFACVGQTHIDIRD